MLQQSFGVADEDVHILADAKHFLPEEQPETLVRYIDAFIQAYVHK
ncbi:MAG: hypothetical protein H6765_00540 [Candidatus Peribacteria bacterium]|nr:MAG: hypothetical protein H6765_00540 [Candidatus Peribacteria bacterium]